MALRGMVGLEGLDAAAGAVEEERRGVQVVEAAMGSLS
jgi:hypothetical protein